LIPNFTEDYQMQQQIQRDAWGSVHTASVTWTVCKCFRRDNGHL